MQPLSILGAMTQCSFFKKNMRNLQQCKLPPGPCLLQHSLQGTQGVVDVVHLHPNVSLVPVCQEFPLNGMAGTQLGELGFISQLFGDLLAHSVLNFRW